MKLQTSYVHYGRRILFFTMAMAGLITGPIALGMAVTLAQTMPAVGWSLVALTVLGVLGGSYAFVRSLSAKRGTVSVSKDGVDLDGKVTLPRSEIATAAFTPLVGRRPPSVRFVNERGRELGWVQVANAAEGDRLLGALGLGRHQTSAVWNAMAKRGTAGFWIVLATMLVSMLAGLGVAVALHIPQIVMLMFVPFVAVSLVFSPAKVHVGSDGLLYAMRVGSRFFPWSEVLAIESIPTGIVVVHKSGERYEIPTMPSRSRQEQHRAAQASLVARAREALAAFQRGDVPDVSTRVARLGRTTEEWIRQLRDREGTFRQAPLRSEDLWRVVESPGAETTARAGAAAVLAQEASEEDRVRLRVAADTCAEPRLRVVLEKAAVGDDVMEALGQIEAAEIDEVGRRARMG